MEILRYLNEFLDSGRWLRLLFLILGIMLAVALVRLQHGANKFDFKDILLNPDTGRASPDRFFLFGAFCASTWAFIVLVDKNGLQEWFFNGYIALWAGSRLVYKWLDDKNKPLPPPANQQINMDIPADANVSVTTGDKK